jgi:hypothetical protein
MSPRVRRPLLERDLLIIEHPIPSKGMSEHRPFRQGLDGRRCMRMKALCIARLLHLTLSRDVLSRSLRALAPSVAFSEKEDRWHLLLATTCRRVPALKPEVMMNRSQNMLGEHQVRGCLPPNRQGMVMVSTWKEGLLGNCSASILTLGEQACYPPKMPDMPRYLSHTNGVWAKNHYETMVR